VARAHALTGALTETREALAAGRVSPEQADIIVRSIEDLPSGAAVRARGQQVLVEQAGSLDASDLARTGRHLVHVVDPDAEDRRLERELVREERAAHHDRYLSITPDGAGGVRLKGRGTAEDGARRRDPREHGARMWDALVQIAHHALDTDLPPEPHGARLRLTITVAQAAGP
jgi:hypothetical protein